MNSFIKSLMEEKNLKQKELAEILGISSSMVSQWNDEATNIGIDSLYSISKLFHVTVDELLDGKRSGELLEDKWKREYPINERAAREAFIDGEKDKVLLYLNALRKADLKFFELFEKKITGEISSAQLKEWSFLRQFYEIKIPGYKSDDGRWVSNRDKRFDDVLLDTLINKIGRHNKEAILWQLKKIYNITRYGVGVAEGREVVPVDRYYEDYGEDPLEYLKDDEDVFYAVYNILSPIEKNNFITEAYHGNSQTSYLYELIKRGGNILYTRNDFNMPNYDYKDLTDMKGDVKPVPEMDGVHALLWEVYGMDVELSYEQYQILINRPKMEQIEMAIKYKEKSPIKYWEFIRDNSTILL